MMKSLVKVLVVLMALFIFATPAFAQTGVDAKAAADIAKQGNSRVGPGIGIGLSVLGIGLGLGIIGYAALSGVARQPEQAGVLRGLMILLAALVEGAGIIGILFSLAMLFL